MSETDLRFLALSGDFKINFCALPLAFVLSEIEIVVQNTPDDFLARDEFGYFDRATMDVFVMIRKLNAEFCRCYRRFLLTTTYERC